MTAMPPPTTSPIGENCWQTPLGDKVGDDSEKLSAIVPLSIYQPLEASGPKRSPCWVHPDGEAVHRRRVSAKIHCERHVERTGGAGHVASAVLQHGHGASVEQQGAHAQRRQENAGA